MRFVFLLVFLCIYLFHAQEVEKVYMYYTGSFKPDKKRHFKLHGYRIFLTY